MIKKKSSMDTIFYSHSVISCTCYIFPYPYNHSCTYAFLHSFILIPHQFQTEYIQGLHNLLCMQMQSCCDCIAKSGSTFLSCLWTNSCTTSICRFLASLVSTCHLRISQLCPTVTAQDRILLSSEFLLLQGTF